MHDPDFAKELFEYMRTVLQTIVRVEDQAVPCGLSPDFRFYRYFKGEKPLQLGLHPVFFPLTYELTLLLFLLHSQSTQFKTPGLAHT